MVLLIGRRGFGRLSTRAFSVLRWIIFVNVVIISLNTVRVRQYFANLASHSRSIRSHVLVELKRLFRVLNSRYVRDRFGHIHACLGFQYIDFDDFEL